MCFQQSTIESLVSTTDHGDERSEERGNQWNVMNRREKNVFIFSPFFSVFLHQVCLFVEWVYFSTEKEWVRASSEKAREGREKKITNIHYLIMGYIGSFVKLLLELRRIKFAKTPRMKSAFRFRKDEYLNGYLNTQYVGIVNRQYRYTDLINLWI